MKQAIKFVREELTHLDPHLVQDSNLHPELFMNYDWVLDLKEKLQARQSDPSLNRPLIGMTEYIFADGSNKAIPVEVVGFDPASTRFYVANKEHGINTMRSRVYICLEDDHPGELTMAKRDAVSMRAEARQYLRVARLIQNEMLMRYGHIALPEEVRTAVNKRIKIDMNRYDPRDVKKLILQVEALYVFAMLKATLSS